MRRDKNKKRHDAHAYWHYGNDRHSNRHSTLVACSFSVFMCIPVAVSASKVAESIAATAFAAP